jgi:putative membrane protein
MRIKRFLSAEDRHAIGHAVKEAEIKTSRRIVPVIVFRSSRYDWIGYRAAILGWVVASAVAAWFYFFRPFMIDLWEFEALQVAGMLIGWIVSRFPFGVRLLVSEHTLALEVDHAAHAAFMHHGLMNTPERNGVLIYVSLRERRVRAFTRKWETGTGSRKWLVSWMESVAGARPRELLRRLKWCLTPNG